MDEDKQAPAEQPVTETPPAETPIEQTTEVTPLTTPVETPVAAVPAEKSKGKIKVVALVAAAVIAIGGGTFAALSLISSQNDDTKVLDAISNLSSLDNFTVDVDIDATDPQSEAVDISALDLTATLNVHQTGLSGNVAVDIDGQPLSIDIFSQDQTLAIRLTGLDTLLGSLGDDTALAGGFDYSAILSPFEGSWIGLDAEDLSQAGLVDPAALNAQDTEEAEALLKRLEDVIDKHDFFDATATTQTRTLDGVTLDGYVVELDPEATTALLEDLMTVVPDGANALAEFDASQTQTAIREFNEIENLDAIVWVDDMYMRAFELTGSDPNSEASLSAVVEITNLNSAPALEAPTFDYTFEDIIGAIFASALSGLEGLEFEEISQ